MIVKIGRVSNVYLLNCASLYDSFGSLRRERFLRLYHLSFLHESSEILRSIDSRAHGQGRRPAMVLGKCRSGDSLHSSGQSRRWIFCGQRRESAWKLYSSCQVTFDHSFFFLKSVFQMQGSYSHGSNHWLQRKVWICGDRSP